MTNLPFAEMLKVGHHLQKIDEPIYTDSFNFNKENKENIEK